MRAALAATTVSGVVTNLDLLHAIASHRQFVAGAIDTGFIARNTATLIPEAAPAPREVLAAAALGVLIAEAEATAASAARSADPGSPWNAHDGWWLNTTPERVLDFAPDAGRGVRVTTAGGAWRLVIDGEPIAANAERLPDGDLAMVLDGVCETVSVDGVGARTLAVRWRGCTWRLLLPEAAGAGDDAASGEASLAAPLPGLVTAVAAEQGASVKRGEILVTMEAMKTVFRLAAPADAVVAVVNVRAGEQVSEGQELIGFAPTL